MSYVIATDIGGTCTDCAVVDHAGAVIFGKTFSTPPDFAGGIKAVLDQVAARLGTDARGLLSQTTLFLHSTTVAENAVVDATLAKAGLIMTRGFEETVMAMRGGYGRWSGLTDLEKRDPINTDKPPPLIPRDLTRAVSERVEAHGEVLLAVQDDEVKRAVQELVDQGVQSLAVACLWSFMNPVSENRIRDLALAEHPDLFVTTSSEIAPVIGEYERASTAALNARLGPVVAHYLADLTAHLESLGFSGNVLIMQASGGLVPVEHASHRPVGMIESGPVGGIVGSQHVAELMGLSNIIAADMGGTTFKVGVVREGLIEYQRESMVFRYHYALPKIDVTSLGLAGGSVISVDPRTGVPHVGPKSAGSYPGPVCYGHGGTEPTITDVDAVLGYLNPAFFLGGEVPLTIDTARRAFELRVAGPMGLSVEAAAAGIYRLANSMMYDLLHKITVERGIDPRDYALVSFGGTAAMHVTAYASQLGVRRVIVPHSASVQGAFGLLTADIVHEAQVTRPMKMPADPATVAAIYEQLEQTMVNQLQEEGFGPDRRSVARLVDMRYTRQVHILTVPLTAGAISQQSLEDTVSSFDHLYQQKYGEGSGYLGAGVELVAFRVRGTGRVGKPSFMEEALDGVEPSAALIETRRAWVDSAKEFRQVPGYDFTLLRPGNVIVGPAIVWTPITTVVVGGNEDCTLDGRRNLVIERRA